MLGTSALDQDHDPDDGLGVLLLRNIFLASPAVIERVFAMSAIETKPSGEDRRVVLGLSAFDFLTSGSCLGPFVTRRELSRFSPLSVYFDRRPALSKERALSCGCMP